LDKVKENNMEENINEKYMRMAIELAKKGAGAVNPNPMVGAVVVKNGEVIGRGYPCGSLCIGRGWQRS